MQELMNLAQMATQLPLNYGGLYQSAYQPLNQYYSNQANNMTALGGQQMGLYGNLAGQQAAMYQAELPFQMEMQKFNAVAPALAGLLSGWGGEGGGGGGGSFSISPISMNFNRPNVMAGYGDAVGRAYSQAASYDAPVQQAHGGMMALMPTAAYLTRTPKGPANTVSTQEAAPQQEPPAYLPPPPRPPRPAPTQNGQPPINYRLARGGSAR